MEKGFKLWRLCKWNNKRIVGIEFRITSGQVEEDMLIDYVRVNGWQIEKVLFMGSQMMMNAFYDGVLSSYKVMKGKKIPVLMRGMKQIVGD